jgi:hypothetical protein
MGIKATSLGDAAWLPGDAHTILDPGGEPGRERLAHLGVVNREIVVCQDSAPAPVSALLEEAVRAALELLARGRQEACACAPHGAEPGRPD